MENDGLIQVFDVWGSRESFGAFGATLLPIMADGAPIPVSRWSPRCTTSSSAERRAAIARTTPKGHWLAFSSEIGDSAPSSVTVPSIPTSGWRSSRSSVSSDATATPRRRTGEHSLTLTRPLTKTATPLTFTDVAEQHLDDVFGYLLYLTRDRAAADDLVGATFEKALRQWSRFDPRRGTARTWLLGIARTTALDSFRADSRRRRREEAAAEPEAREADFVEGLSPTLQTALATLSAGEREVLALRIVIELDGDQTARVLGISPTAVSTRLSRALTKLEEKVRNDDLR